MDDVEYREYVEALEKDNFDGSHDEYLKWLKENEK